MSAAISVDLVTVLNFHTVTVTVTISSLHWRIATPFDNGLFLPGQRFIYHPASVLVNGQEKLICLPESGQIGAREVQTFLQ